MVKVTGPMMSLDASGTVAGTVTFSKWKGRNYVRQRVKPHNPKSVMQISMRAMMKFLSQSWAAVTAPDKASWEDKADARAISTFNAYVSENQNGWRNFDAPKTDEAQATNREPDDWTSYTATPGVREMLLTLTTDGNESVNWGCIIYRSTTTGFTPSLSNVIAVIHSELNTEVMTYSDGPLEADDYYYQAQMFSIDGVFGALSTQFTGEIT